MYGRVVKSRDNIDLYIEFYDLKFYGEKTAEEAVAHGQA